MFWFALVLLIILLIFAFCLRLKNRQPLSKTEPKPILTKNELEFFHHLQSALPEHRVFPQVAANAILKVAKGTEKSHYHMIRNQFSQKHVDFLICDYTDLDIKAIIELDDKTHNPEKDKKRDALFQQAGYRVIRFRSKNKPSASEIAELFNSLPSTKEISALPSTQPEHEVEQSQSNTW